MRKKVLMFGQSYKSVRKPCSKYIELHKIDQMLCYLFDDQIGSMLKNGNRETSTF